MTRRDVHGPEQRGLVEVIPENAARLRRRVPKDKIKVVILCGGQGTRAYPYTDHLPKAMLPVNGLPMVVHVMRLYADQGYRNFVLSLDYLASISN